MEWIISQLHSSLCQFSVAPRGVMYTSQYKVYVLILLFMKNISDMCSGKFDSLLEVFRHGNFSNINVEIAALEDDCNMIRNSRQEVMQQLLIGKGGLVNRIEHENE